MVSALAISSRLSAASPTRLSSWVSKPVSKDCRRGVSAASHPDLTGTGQLERQILRKPLGAVDVLTTRDAAMDGLAQQVRQRELRVLPAP